MMTKPKSPSLCEKKRMDYFGLVTWAEENEEAFRIIQPQVNEI
jgi:hypothetical protein